MKIETTWTEADMEIAQALADLHELEREEREAAEAREAAERAAEDERQWEIADRVAATWEDRP